MPGDSHLNWISTLSPWKLLPVNVMLSTGGGQSQWGCDLGKWGRGGEDRALHVFGVLKQLADL